MPWRMLLFLVVLALLVVLAAANLENRASFSFVLRGLQLDDVPVFLALLAAFIAGALTMLPFTIGRRHPHARKHRQSAGKESQERPPGREPAAPVAPPQAAPLPNEPPDTGRRGGKRKPRRRRRERAAER